MIETAFHVGSVFGVRHAFEADHLAAITTLVEDGNRSASTGAAWGIGHSIPILVLGVSFLSLDAQIPSTVTAGFEVLVAVALVALGVRVIAGRDALGTSLLRHVHTEDAEKSGTGHLHLTIGER